MVSDDMRSMARTLADIGDTREATPLECLSFALNLMSFANLVREMETAAIPPEKRGLTIINGGKT